MAETANTNWCWIDAFDRNPLNFFYFLELFKETVEKKIGHPKVQLTRLVKFTRGEAKELIQLRI